MSLSLTSPVFKHKESIPELYTCDGENINPPLKIYGVPEEASSLVLIVDDPDAPIGNWDHWVIFNIPKETSNIAEDSSPKGIRGENSWEKLGYGGPCPPDGEHRYIFKLYALDIFLDLQEGSNKQEVEGAMSGHILEQAQLVGLYSRK